MFCCAPAKRRTAHQKHTDVILNHADGLDWATLCKCDFVYSVPAHQLSQKRVVVTTTRRPAHNLRIRTGRIVGLWSGHFRYRWPMRFLNIAGRSGLKE